MGRVPFGGQRRPHTVATSSAASVPEKGAAMSWGCPGMVPMEHNMPEVFSFLAYNDAYNYMLALECTPQGCAHRCEVGSPKLDSAVDYKLAPVSR